MMGRSHYRRVALLFLFVPAASCFAFDWDYQGAGDLAASSSSSASSSSGDVASSSSSGASSSGGGVGGAGGGSATSSASSSSSSAGAPPSWNEYSFDMATGTWSTVPLSAVWTGANAPPTTGIMAAERFYHFPKLLVFADNGMLYVQDKGAWQPPVPIQARFPEVDTPMSIDGIYSVPSDWNISPMGMPLYEGMTFVRNPTAWAYKYFENDTTEFVTTVTLADAPPPAAPQGTGKALWIFAIWNISQVGQPDGFVGWEQFNNGFVYKLDATFNWTEYPVADGPIWAGKPGAPPWATLRAAYFKGDPQNGQGVVVLLGP